MVILAVDNNPDRLWALVKNLRLAFPGDTVEYTHDPLMAGRFINNNPVDILFAALKMRVLDGEELKAMLRIKFPAVKVFLMADEKELDEYLYDESDSHGVIQRPVTERKLRDIVTQET